MELNLKDKVAVVTGASKGIGLAVVEALGREGARVVAGSRSTTPALAALCDTYDVTVVTVDLAITNGPASLITAAAERHGRIDALVNNVGIASPRSSFLSVDDAEWQRVFDLTFFSAVRASRAALPHLLASGGAIVNISSINARLPFPMVVDYSAAKALRPPLRHAVPRGPRPGARVARALRPRGRRRAPRQDLLRRHAPAPGPRRRTRRPPARALPGRADHRPGPSQPPEPVGDASPIASRAAPPCC